MKKKIISIFILLIFILNTYSFAIYASIPVWSEDENTAEVNAETAEDFLNIESESAILIEQTTGQILYEKNSHEQLRPASVTKIMTILLIMEALDRGDITLETQIPCSENASKMGGSQIWLDETETLSVHEMLKAICVVSANDCTYAMAEYLAGSEELFVQKMNERAKQLGMNDTTFKNCHGIDEDGHVTSSYDISLMSRELLQNHPSITNYTTIWMDSLRDGKSELVNTNKLIRTYDGITGLKTGSTSLALYNLSASATREDLSLIAVVMRAPTAKDRFQDAKLLLDYGFNTYTFQKIATKDSVVQNVNINKGVQNSVNLVFENDSGVLLKKSNSSEIKQELSINENIEAPISKGTTLGSMNYYIDDNLISSVNLVAETDVSKKTLLNTFNYICTNWLNLLRT
jgi:D-alanyl-D-alanine carboxypeptidase (penicillin-binding protein 5/6)